MVFLWNGVLQEMSEQAPDSAPAGGISSRTFVLALMILLTAASLLMVVFAGLRLKGLLKRIPKVSSKSLLDTLLSEHKLHSTMAVLIRAFLRIANVLYLRGPVYPRRADLGHSLLPRSVAGQHRGLAALPRRGAGGERAPLRNRGASKGVGRDPAGVSRP